MMFDVSKLSLEELLELNRAVVDRIQFLEERNRQKAMLSFRIGDRVWFQCEKGHKNFGTVVKFNRKTLSVLTEKRERWNIAPVFLKKCKGENKFLPNNLPANVLTFEKRSL